MRPLLSAAAQAAVNKARECEAQTSAIPLMGEQFLENESSELGKPQPILLTSPGVDVDDKQGAEDDDDDDDDNQKTCRLKICPDSGCQATHVNRDRGTQLSAVLQEVQY